MGMFTKLLLGAIIAAFQWFNSTSAIKIAFVGDTGMEDERYYGYGHMTMKMIEDQGVDLVVDVGDFDYWGRCSESYNVTRSFDLTSTWGRVLRVTAGAVLKRFKWQDGTHGTTKGWEVGINSEHEDKLDIFQIEKEAPVSDAFDMEERMVVSDGMWTNVVHLLNQTEDCGGWGEPWDGPFEWNQFIRNHDFAFLGSSGNAEVKPIDGGGADIWKSHQRYMHSLYMERIYNVRKGTCHGYFDPEEPGSVEEYGERYSCFYRNNDIEDFHFIFLGWWQGSDEHWHDESKEERRRSVDFIDREFNTTRSQNVRWRFCIQHMTSAKLSAGDEKREHMELSPITDACRRHGAIIVSGHHHLYSRTKLLESVGGENGDEEVVVSNTSDSYTIIGGRNASIIREGVTLSLTVGAGGYDSSCNGKYAKSPWMEICVASLLDHRGAVIAEFDHQTPWIGNFQYLNSLADGAVIDEFLVSTLLSNRDGTIPVTNTTTDPLPQVHGDQNETSSPTHEIYEATEASTSSPVTSGASTLWDGQKARCVCLFWWLLVCLVPNLVTIG